MAKSTGIVLTAGAISFTNSWLHKGTPNFRIPIATLAVALIFDGIEHVNEQAAVGLSALMMVTALLAPVNGDAPMTTALKLVSAKPTTKIGTDPLAAHTAPQPGPIGTRDGRTF